MYEGYSKGVRYGTIPNDLHLTTVLLDPLF